MRTLNGWRTYCFIFLFCSVTAIAALPQTFTKLADFQGYDGEAPLFVSLTQGVDGALYGTTSYGGGGGYGQCQYDEPGCGTVFRITLTSFLTTVHRFCSQNNCADGSGPYAGVIQATDGNLYGTTWFGNTIFKISRDGFLSTLHTFCTQTGCPDGAQPTAGLIQASDGNFYGTTSDEGAYGYGTVFKITADGALTTLHSFNHSDGANPLSGLIQGTDGSIYGTTSVGGKSSCNWSPVNGCGTIFKITPNGSFITLHNFQGNDGTLPWGGLVQANDGAFYGTTFAGGPPSCTGELGCGTVFRVTSTGKLTTIHTFTDDGCAPSGTLIQATDGNLYGTTQGIYCTGQQGFGAAFRITPSGVFTNLHIFSGGDGANPFGGLVQATDGNFYGTTSEGGDYTHCEGTGCGTVFSLDMGLGPFESFLRNPAKVGQEFGILGQGLRGTTSVELNDLQANFTVVSDTLIKATVPPGATTGYVTVTTPTGVLTSNVPFQVIQ